jgi:hypothetical protein
VFAAEIVVLERELECGRKKIVKCREETFHSNQRLEKRILRAHDIHAGDSIDSLIREEVHILIIWEKSITPKNDRKFIFGRFRALERAEGVPDNVGAHPANTDFDPSRKHLHNEVSQF